MEPFRSVRGGGARASLAAAEASLLRNLVGQIMTLVEPDQDPQSPQNPQVPVTSGNPDDLAALEAMLHPPGPAQTPEDPVLARLLPDAYSDDPEAAGEFRKYTEPARRRAQYEGARGVVDPRPAPGGRRPRTQDPQGAAYEVYAWLGAVQESLVQALA